MDKISALESELAKLKAQIAVYALAETKDLPVPAAPPPPPPPPPALSTASNAQVCQLLLNEHVSILINGLSSFQGWIGTVKRGHFKVSLIQECPHFDPLYCRP